MSTPSTNFSGLACSSTPLGVVPAIISPYVQYSAEESLSQICDRPADTMYRVTPDGVTISAGTPLVDLTITLAADGGSQNPDACRSAFYSILMECVGSEGAWGGEVYDGDITYCIAKADGADDLVEYIENSSSGEQPDGPASGFPSGTIEASGVASGFPEQSGTASGYPGDDGIFTTLVAIPSGYPGDYFPTPTATVIASGYPIESAFVPSGVESGYMATPTAEAPVYPDWSEFDSYEKERRGSGEREDFDAEKRPAARWIRA